MSDLASRILARQAAEAAAAQAARQAADSTYWSAVAAEAEGQPTTDADAAALEAALVVLGRSLTDFRNDLSDLLAVDRLRIEGDVAAAREQLAAVREQNEHRAAEARRLRAEADGLDAAARDAGLAASEALRAAKLAAGQARIIATALAERGCTSRILEGLVAAPAAEPIEVIALEECRDPQGRHHARGTRFLWPGDRELPRHLRRADAPVEQPVEVPVVEQATVVAQPVGLDHEHFAVGGEA